MKFSATNNKAVYPVLGIPVQVYAENPDLGRLIENRYGHWRKVPIEDKSGQPVMVVNIEDFRSSNNRVGSEEIAYKVKEYLVEAYGPGFSFMVDRKSGRAEAKVDPRVAANRDFFIRSILDTMVLFLATSIDRIPLHAAVIICHETAMILCGQAGSGKTTLAYELYRRGAGVLAESVVYISFNSLYRLWGDVQSFNLRPDAKEIFPELADLKAKKLPNGKTKIQLNLPKPGQDDRRLFNFNGPMKLVMVERVKNSQSTLEAIAYEEAFKKLLRDLEPGFDLSHEFKSKMPHFPVSGAYRLQAGDDLHRKADLIEMLCAGGKSSEK